MSSQPSTLTIRLRSMSPPSLSTVPENTVNDSMWAPTRTTFPSTLRIRLNHLSPSSLQVVPEVDEGDKLTPPPPPMKKRFPRDLSGISIPLFLLE